MKTDLIEGLRTRADVARLLTEARARTLQLLAPLSESDLREQHDPLMSPIIWDLGHIAHFEELWLTRNLSGPIEFSEMPGMFNPFEHPRAERGALPLPSLEDSLATMARIRERALETLEHVDLDAETPLLMGGYVYSMVAQHEYQHNETILQTLQLKRGLPYVPAVVRPLPRPAHSTIAAGEMVYFPGGRATLGTDDRTAAYDNERPRHSVAVAPYWIDVAPVSNGDFLAFIAAGGYERRELWSDAGWAWRAEHAIEAPKYWSRKCDAWTDRVMHKEAEIDPDRPVCHVSFYEAEAFCQFAGKRLPTEIEWEVAASWDPARHEQRRFPWGEADATPDRANVDQLTFDTAPRGSYTGNVSPNGCYGMIGDVWEWTSSDLTGYPGFTAFPYAEYSEAFFRSEYKVLRGGSWATRSGAIRSTFRNWDYPIRRQIFSGFRCARDG